MVQLAPPVVPVPAIDYAQAGKPSNIRPCFFGGADPVDTPIYKSTSLTPGMQVFGPSIIEEPTTTLVVFPGMSAKVSGAGNYILGIS